MNTTPPRVILLHAEAPPKPAVGAACNGCGVCCAWQPCPLGMLVSRRRHGPCVALSWQAPASIYRCGMLTKPEQHLPRGLHWLARPLRRLARRWIAAGQGCDSTLEVQPGPAAAPAAAPTPH